MAEPWEMPPRPATRKETAMPKSGPTLTDSHARCPALFLDTHRETASRSDAHVDRAAPAAR
eukprot:3977120-Pyramimonas_sp.AAC.1